MKTPALLLVCCTLSLPVLAIPTPVQLYDNGTPAGDIISGGIHFFPDIDDFQLAQDSTLTSVQFETLTFIDKCCDRIVGIDYDIRADNNGAPGPSVASGTGLITRNEETGREVLLPYWDDVTFEGVVNFDLAAPLALTGGQRYWLFLNPDIRPGDNRWVMWEGTPNAIDLAFTLNGTTAVPDSGPATALLLASALSMLACVRRR